MPVVLFGKKTRSKGIKLHVGRFFRLLDPQSELEIISYRISQILFCARGPSNSSLACCWAFTTSRVSTSTNSAQFQQNGNNGQIGKVQQELLYQCQVFRCDNQEAVRRFSPPIVRKCRDLDL